MVKLLSEAEKIIRKMVRKGELEILSEDIFNSIFDEVEQDMVNYRLTDNYRKGISLIEPNKILVYQKIN